MQRGEPRLAPHSLAPTQHPPWGRWLLWGHGEARTWLRQGRNPQSRELGIMAVAMSHGSLSRGSANGTVVGSSVIGLITTGRLCSKEVNLAQRAVWPLSPSPREGISKPLKCSAS